MRRFMTLFFAVTISCSVHSKTAKSSLVLLSIDGFAYDYLAKYQPKNILAFAKSGVKAKLLPVYPSKTFPNHLSIITGEYPINHGIIHNKFYHPLLGEQYTLGAGKKNSTWLTAKPLWSVAEENNITTAVYFWPESEAIGQGSQPSFNIPYNTVDAEKTQFDQIISWLKLPQSQAPKFIVSYFASIDDKGHKYGPNSLELKQAVADIDDLFGYFISRLHKEIPGNVNIILVSDHGMMQIDKEVNISQVFNEQLTKWIDEKSMIVAKSSTQLYIYFDKSKLNKSQQKVVFQSLKSKKNTNTPLYQVHQKGHYPKHWQLNEDLAIVPDLIVEIAEHASFTSEKHPNENAATHGYDAKNKQALMAVFIASGPDIIKGRELDAFENIHIAPLMSNLLGLQQPNKIDGKRSILAPIIKIN